MALAGLLLAGCSMIPGAGPYTDTILDSPAAVTRPAAPVLPFALVPVDAALALRIEGAMAARRVPEPAFLPDLAPPPR